MSNQQHGLQLKEAARLSRDKILNPGSLSLCGGIASDTPVLVMLAAGRGTRFGQDPKCIVPVHGTPLARHSIDAFRRVFPAPAICLVGYRYEDVSAAIGPDVIYVRSDNPVAGTAYATFEALSVEPLSDHNPVLIITMGDRIVPAAVFRRLWEKHHEGEREADLTFLTAVYEPPKNRGKGRVLRREDGRVLRIIEERDIAAEGDDLARRALMQLTEGNCPLYAVRARTLRLCLEPVTNDNAQGQYYLTDIIQSIALKDGDIRTISTIASDAEYDLLCADVTQPRDLALLEGIFASSRGDLFPDETQVDNAARAIAADRPAGQTASIARQLEELFAAASRENLGFRPDRPVAIGISGGRLRIAFMHPDMGRFFGPAWQIPVGAGDAAGSEQIVMLAQPADDRRIHLHPMEPQYRESVDFIPADEVAMYPDEDIRDLHSYEAFGTRMSENLLLSLGYFADSELDQRRLRNVPLPPPSLWVGNNMRRPFALISNAIASMRTLRSGTLGARVQEHLGRENFDGLRIVSTGSIPQGGFSSSSAVTVACKNAINSLFDIGIPPDLLVHLACQAEYGTGVRAGSLDQATEQKGNAGQGALISSNPRDNYRVLGSYPVSERFVIIFPYSVERDRAAWLWSWGAYARAPTPGMPLTSGETRKMTGKAAEIAALLTRLPLDIGFFQSIEEDLLEDGMLSRESSAWIRSVLMQLPLCIPKDELRARVTACRDWYSAQLEETERLSGAEARQRADAVIESLFAGWRNPTLRRRNAEGDTVTEHGVPLRAMVAYLFGEVAKNFYLIRHQEQWIEYVTRSQRGDCSVNIDPERLPPPGTMETIQDWERDVTGPERLNRWIERFGGAPFDYNRGIDDAALSAPEPCQLHRLEGSSFFRGLALIDLAEAMLKRAFGRDAVAVRVNAAGQGDYFQVHVDRTRAEPSAVKQFIRAAFYRRFGITPSPEFVELHPGGGAAGVRLSRFDALPSLVHRLRAAAAR